jgi:hypothetical protein
MSSCTFEELVARVAAMMREGASREDVEQLLALLSPAYRADILAGADDLLRQDAAVAGSDQRRT